MNEVIYEWFEIRDEDFRSDEERLFTTALVSHASRWKEFGISSNNGLVHFGDSFFTLAIDVSDQTEPSVLRTLRIDFYGTKILMGEDETGQLVTALDSQWHDVVTHGGADMTPKSFACIAAVWLDKEMARTIERHEWRSRNWFGKKWRHSKNVFKDTGKALSWWDSEQVKRTNLGQPDKITTIYPLTTVKLKDENACNTS